MSGFPPGESNPTLVTLGILGEKVDNLARVSERLAEAFTRQSGELAAMRVEFSVAIAEVKGVVAGLFGLAERLQSDWSPLDALLGRLVVVE